MRPDARAAERFFAALPAVCPVERITHLHLNHWSEELAGAVTRLLQEGFTGRVVTARVSLHDTLAGALPPGRVVLDDHPSAGEPAAHLLMELPQGREAVLMAVARAQEQLPPDGALWLFGHRELGIQGVAKLFPHTQTLLSKGHLRLVSIPPRAAPLPLNRKRSEPPPALAEDGCLHLPVTLAGQSLTLATLPGLFSWRQVDPATRLLVEAALAVDPGPSLLDWGCGNGVVGAAMGRRWPQLHVTLSDDLWRAVRCSRRTLELNGLADRGEVVAENGIGPQLTGRRFSTILTNPPFHRGVETDHRAARTFLARAARLLTHNGWIWVVGNRFLAYDQPMGEIFSQVETVAADQRFTVWRGRRPFPSSRWEG